jgi:hypothetical protein
MKRSPARPVIRKGSDLSAIGLPRQVAQSRTGHSPPSTACGAPYPVRKAEFDTCRIQQHA